MYETLIRRELNRMGHNGDVDPREVYQVPRPEYFDALDDVTGDD